MFELDSNVVLPHRYQVNKSKYPQNENFILSYEPQHIFVLENHAIFNLLTTWSNTKYK